MERPSKIRLEKKRLRLKDFEKEKDAGNKKKYEQKLGELQLTMLRVQQAYHHQKIRAMLVFEGWDAGGKGGAIKRLTEKLDPRGYAVHPIGPPTPEEQGRHYLYRFWDKVPRPGQLVLFDRSWYGRVLVERIQGFAKRNEWQRAYEEINEFERVLLDDGVRILKFFMHISKKEQLGRFEERLKNPYKRWKITEDDIVNHERWSDYRDAIEDMFDRTSTKAAPWHVIAGNDKHYARLRVLEIAVKTLGEGVDLSVPVLKPGVAIAARERLRIDIDGGKG
jgi:polyphosphate kinase 2 (PPK2 family)